MMAKNLEATINVTTASESFSVSLPPIAELPFPVKSIGGNESVRQCHGVLYDAALVVPTVLFVLYLVVHAKKNLTKLCNGRSYIMISYYALLWLACVLNLAWCSLQGWQCSAGKEVAWNLLSLFTVAAVLYLEISLMAFLLQESYASGLETLALTFIISGIIVGVDMLLKLQLQLLLLLFVVHDAFQLGNDTRQLFSIPVSYYLIYGFILFVHFSKWREKLPSRPAFYHYVVVMFVVSAVAFFGCVLAGTGAAFGIWLYNLTVICYHSLYLPLLYATFLADFFPGGKFSSG